MRIITVFFIVLLTLSCDDGNFDIPEFNFENITIENCGDVVLYKVNENETLILEIDPKLGIDEGTFLTHHWDNEPFSVTTNGTNKIIYRTLDEKPTANYYCQNIPPTAPKVTSEWIGTGNALVNTIFTQDDEDGVEESIEDLNGDGDLANDDTDGDTISNYIDSDDDGDGILTKNEDIDGDGDPTNDDTDGDGKPNYLDDNDDNDSLLTKQESSTEDADGNGIVDYLDSNTQNTLSEPRTLKNSYKKLYQTTIIINSLKLTNTNGNTINYDEYDFGTITTEEIIKEK